MDNSYLIIMDAFSLFCGIYILYTFFKLHTTGHLFQNSVIVPSGKTPANCKDEKGFIGYIKYRMLILGIVIIIVGVLNVINEFYPIYNIVVTELLIGVAVAVLVWYCVCSSKAFKKYW
ncbi:MAG: hypothetical protein ACI3VB_00715 [Oscillospiraceae bacterium]